MIGFKHLFQLPLDEFKKQEPKTCSYFCMSWWSVGTDLYHTIGPGAEASLNEHYLRAAWQLDPDPCYTASRFPHIFGQKQVIRFFSHPGTRNQINSRITWQIAWELRTFSQTNINFPFVFRQQASVKFNRFKKKDIKVEGKLLGEDCSGKMGR